MSVIHKKLKFILKYLSVIHRKTLLNWIWDDYQWFSMLCEKLWRFILGWLSMILNDFICGDSQWFTKILKFICGQFFMMIHGDSGKNSEIYLGTILQWCLMILDDSQKTLNLSNLFWAIHWNLFGMILNLFRVILENTLKFIWGDCRWILNDSSMILGDLQKNSEIYFGQFSVILTDSKWFSQKSLKCIWVILSDFQWFSVIH